MDFKKNLPLIFGIAIPILMIAFVAGSIYIPQLFVKPQYNFVYLLGNNRCYIYPNDVQIYSIRNSRIVKNADEEAAKCLANNSPGLKFFLYDVTVNTSTPITFEQAQLLTLIDSAESPDGFKILNGGNNGGFFPFYYYSGSDYYSKYLTGHNISKKLNIQTDGHNYYNFALLGWIQK